MYFADHESLHDGMTGHPDGVEWFCGLHYEVAERLSKGTYAEARKELKRIYGPFGKAPQWLASIRIRLRPPKKR